MVTFAIDDTGLECSRCSGNWCEWSTDSLRNRAVDGGAEQLYWNQPVVVSETVRRKRGWQPNHVNNGTLNQFMEISKISTTTHTRLFVFLIQLVT